jgi:hypothetical protein
MKRETVKNALDPFTSLDSPLVQSLTPLFNPGTLLKTHPSLGSKRESRENLSQCDK